VSTTDYPRVPDRVVSPNGKLVVLYVQVCEEPTVDRLAAQLGLSKLTVMTLVERLADRGVLRVEGEVLRSDWRE
jgi:predicted DNA-binding transcriptional regulator